MQFLSRKVLKRLTNNPWRVPRVLLKMILRKLIMDWQRSIIDAKPSKYAKEKFAEINKAYEALQDENQRKVYDQVGMTGDEQDQAGAQDSFAIRKRGGRAQEYQFDETIFGDYASFLIWEDKRYKLSEQTFIYNWKYHLWIVLNGHNKQYNLRKQEFVSTSNGTRCKLGTVLERCTNCCGSGSLNYRQGSMAIQMVFIKCRGSGVSIKNSYNTNLILKDTTCKGAGIQKQSTPEFTNIPKGKGRRLNYQNLGQTRFFLQKRWL